MTWIFIYVQLNYTQHKWTWYVQTGNSLFSIVDNFDYFMNTVFMALYTQSLDKLHITNSFICTVITLNREMFCFD